MRNLTYSLFFLLILVFFGFNSVDASVKISGTITNTDDSILSIVFPIRGIYFNGNEEKIKVNSSKTFLFNLEAERIGEITLYVHGSNKCRMFLNPGDSINVLITKSGDKYNYIFKGTNSEGQKYINKFQRNWDFKFEYISDTIAYQLLENDKVNKNLEIEGLYSLYNSNKINREFYEYALNEINYYYALQTALITNSVDSLNVKNYYKSFGQLRKETYDKYPINNTDALNICWWYDYTDDFITYNEIHNKGYYPSQIERIQESYQYITDEYLEAYNAITMFIIFRPTINYEYLELYDNYCTSYPTSVFSPFLDKAIEPTKTLYKKIEGEYIDTSILIKDYSNINSLDELIGKYKGLKLYIDVWATWCGPCRDELKHSKELEILLSKYKYYLLYISMDFEKQDKLWKDMILFYDLEGKNLRANENLYKDLMRLISNYGYYSLPWHMIIDNEGKIKVKNAYGALQLDSLEMQLKEN